MKKCVGGILAIGWLTSAPAAAGEALFISVGETTKAPIGWVEFCAERPHECKVAPTAPRDVVLTAKAWKDLVRINRYVNERIRPMTDLEHHGVVEKWSYPDDGYGDCEDYVLLKRRTLMERSEEHTSELQSLRHLVCRLLLEKKKDREK